MHPHAIVWIDAHQARIVNPDVPRSDATVIEVARPVHDHQKRPDDGRRADHDHHHFAAVAKALVGVRHILICGPATTPKAFATWIKEHSHDIAKALIGVETLDKKTDGEIGDWGRHYFKAADRMH